MGRPTTGREKGVLVIRGMSMEQDGERDRDRNACRKIDVNPSPAILFRSFVLFGWLDAGREGHLTQASKASLSWSLNPMGEEKEVTGTILFTPPPSSTLAWGTQPTCIDVYTDSDPHLKVS